MFTIYLLMRLSCSCIASALQQCSGDYLQVIFSGLCIRLLFLQPVSYTHLCIPANDKDLFILDLAEELPTRQMVVAYNESLPVSQAAKQFMDML